ncbi:MAG: leucyl/phenylalanyl-tRNA--protein transferase [Betaproteobacteria bacterium]|jgi:leucyl/phenylalanyl-tRNA--protein transferase|nr:leucyl/phenylalanyl-tRNA--protein transferase [Betaproteobacteria bacterium]HMV19845.1 leucyl/phenylalanyl-tRNA--protein transferase [Rhodocyclaceae bacterium]HNE42890.1 leucyl/phenylalanyl-tRNA--protein transferase [Rhodocyclaceae bacterium]HNL22363.1 leucyl/phenylalanyl-tRNA--protein transferase [Rhodocyclaceae bacterium]HNM23659.1 leucyl/phenylalanyl-tRNA--protein transferase [Rhodocyclaceae bacterium]
MICILSPLDPFPPVESATPDGFLAIGGGLSPARLLDAYCRGIFPWGTLEGQPLWYAPDPRMVLFPEEFKVSRSLARTLRSGRFDIRFDTDFAGVVAGCAHTPRPGQGGTWITPEMIDAYGRLHELGWAHSVEAYGEGGLVGGLYGLAIGGMFYGESMFSRRSDASKAAFAILVHHLREQGTRLIDCQMHTHHLASLGARPIPRAEFLHRLEHLILEPGRRGPWSAPANPYVR